MKQLKTFMRWFTCAPMLAAVALFAPKAAYAEDVTLKLDYNEGDKNNVEITETAENEYVVKCVGGDPFCATFPLETALTEDYKYIIFEYTADQEIGNELEFFFSPWRGGYSINFGGTPAVSEWKEKVVEVSKAFAADWGFGQVGSKIRFDFGNNSSATLQIRNLRVTNVNPISTTLEQVDGIYQIGTAADLKELSDFVAKGATGVKAALTADIDMAGVEMAPIGSKATPFSGSLNGQGHKISNLVMNMPEAEYVGLVGAITGDAEVRNLVLDATCSFTGKAFMGIIGGSVNGGTIVMDRLGNEGTVTGSAQNVAGIIGVNMEGKCSFKISNCYVTGTISGANESAAISGWTSGGTLTNCYSIATVSGVDGNNTFVRSNPATINCYENYGNNGCTAITEEDVTSGRLCYLLNGNQQEIVFTQCLGEDALPVISEGHKQVYLSCPDGLRCDGTALSENETYTNEPVVIPPHTYDEGICSVCGHFDVNAFEMVDGAYEIANAKQLYWYATLINTVDNTRNARLTADIDFSDYNMSIGIDYHDFDAVFDGQGHKLTIKRVKTDGSENCAPFQCLMGTVKNLWIDGTITSNGKYAASVASHIWKAGAVIENVLSTVTIESSVQGDATNAGILGVADNPVTLKNCVFAGKLTTTGGTSNCGGLIGWASAATTLINCLMVGDIEVGENDTHTISRNGGNCNMQNVWVSKYFANSQQGELASAEMLASGELAYKLGMGQQIGQDGYPSPVSTAQVNTICGQYTKEEVVELTTDVTPKLYYIKNTRTGKYIKFDGSNSRQKEVTEPEGYASMYYFVANGDVEGHFQPIRIYNLAAGDATMASFNSWTVANNQWYLLREPSMTQDGYYIGLNTNTNDQGAWWNDYSGNEIGNWSCDGGSIFAFEVVPAEECPEFAKITYNQIMDERKVRVQEIRAIVGEPFPAVGTPAFVEAVAPEGVVEGDQTFDIPVTVNTPFEASESFADAKWYEIINMHEPNKYLQYEGEEAEVYNMVTESLATDKYLWSFYGNPYDGYKVMNLAAGEGKYLHLDAAGNGQAPLMTAEPTVWEIGQKDDSTFGLGVNGYWINRSGGAGGSEMRLWESGPASDQGSTLTVAYVDVDKRYIIADASENVIATRDNVTLVSTMNRITLTTGSRLAEVAADKQITIYDYFAGEYIEGTVTVNGGFINVDLAEPITTSKLLYVTVPAGMVTMNGEVEQDKDVVLTYYVHGSEIVDEATIERIMAIVAGGATGIEGINAAEGNYNVVNVAGAQVRNGNSLKGLKGLYIVNKKKVVLK